MKLYDFPLSGNAYKARLLLSLANIGHQRQFVDLANGEQKTDSFLALNPAGQVPVLTDNDKVIRGSHGILTYLAHSYAPEYLPTSAEERAEVVEWLGFVNEAINPGVATARLIKLFNANKDHEQAVVFGIASLQHLDTHLQQHDWLVGDHPSVADIAVYPYVRHAEDGDISLADYPAIQAWFSRFEALPGYIRIDQ